MLAVLTLLASTWIFAKPSPDSVACEVTNGKIAGERLVYEFLESDKVVLSDSQGAEFYCEVLDKSEVDTSAFSMTDVKTAVFCEAGFFTSLTVFGEGMGRGEILILDENAGLACD